MKEQISTTTPVENDRIMAALAHATAVLPMMGIVAPIVIWVTQKDKSEYVGFQALQAIAYQFAMILAWFAGMVVYMGSFFAMFAAASLSGPSRSVPVLFFFPFLVMGLMVLGGIVFVVYGLIAAAMVLQGKDFRYMVIGNLLQQYLHKGNTG